MLGKTPQKRTNRHWAKAARYTSLAVGVALLMTGLVACEPTSTEYTTLPPNATLPSDATCAAQVQRAPETRTANTPYDNTKGINKGLTTPYSDMSRVDGNYTGTTDEVIQWAACKWGIDVDIVRAQAAVESWWYQDNVGDFQSNAADCVPGHGIGKDGTAGECPASGGLLSLTYQYYPGGFPQAMQSTAYNLDYVYAWWHACYTGKITWFNDVDHGATYAAGDAWGCIGAWYAGRWRTAAADSYITKVQQYESEKIWTTPGFLGS